ncbi:MAG: glycine zipper domain-containing protein [candidate division NC10 bacterium]|jgi:hypothetical protein|nr:hypothetical protein [candidate division NC10 bacterium]MCH7895859.1 hypothetical protein [candidate division NC10 bacterium]MCZ6550102.1 YMGG-like glycine zipper-containing protein [candidate division NC10 bacterium]
MRTIGGLTAALLLVTACAGGPATTREKGALTGAVIGAGTGAIIGSQTGNAGAGAAIGGAIGGVTGAILGGAVQERERQPGATTYPQQQGGISVPGQYTGDPTRGELANATRWRVAVYVDADPGQGNSNPSLWLGPNEAQPANLDIGQHRIVARAYVDTQFGQRLVGRYDKTVTVDPRSSGWSLRFGEGDFR